MVSFSGSKRLGNTQTWSKSGSGEFQLHAPASREDLQTRARTGRTVRSAVDGFQSLNQNAFGLGSAALGSAGNGRPLQMAQVLKSARFNPTQFTSDLRKLAGDLSNKPLDTAQNMVLGMPTKLVQNGLQAAEDATGLKKEVKGRFSKKIGSFHELRARHQMGALGTHTNTTRARLGASADGQGSLKVGLAGAHGQGSVEARIGGAVETQGNFRNALVDANYKARAGVEAYGSAKGKFNLDASGLKANGRAEIGVAAYAEAHANFRTAGVNIGGERLDINGRGTVRVEAAAKAEVEAQVNATLNPPRANVDIGGRAFAGVKAEAKGEIGLGGFVKLKGHAGAWAGAGAEAGLKLGYNNGKISFGFNFGAAAGYGAGAGGSIEIDVKKVANAAIGGGLQAVAKGVEYALNPEKLVTDAVKTIGTVADTAEKVVDAVDQGIEQAQKTIGTTVANVAKGAANVISNVIQQFKLW